MTDFITLSCPNCGAKLELTKDIDRFACANCGREHIVKRTGGMVLLTPVIEGLRKIEVGVDKTAAELAIVRIKNELAQLQAHRQNTLNTYPMPNAEGDSVIAPGIAFMIAAVLTFFYTANIDMLNQTGIGICIGLMFLIGLVVAISGFRIKSDSSKKMAQRELARQNAIDVIDEQIEAKKRELGRNIKLVS